MAIATGPDFAPSPRLLRGLTEPKPPAGVAASTRGASQIAPGEGPRHAALMLAGEQPAASGGCTGAKLRGTIGDRPGAAVLTIHPACLVRMPDAKTRAAEYGAFVRDLVMARDFVGG